ncbi:MAG: MarR family winged helix-turn-helix transcriptional regulator [Methylophilaceae bacterium]
MDDTPSRGAAPPSDPAPAETRPHTAALDQSRLTHLVGYAASRAAIELKKVFAKQLGPLQLKASEFSLLVLVASNPKVNQKQLGQALDISPPNMAVTIDKLVERGWVERVRSTQDRRAMQIHLTTSGRELVERAEKIAMTMENPALRVLSAAERALLIELLLKVAAGGSRKR